jgi:TolA-binding protein
LYQNKVNPALEEIKKLENEESDSAGLKKSAILDDVYWLEADIRMKQGKFQIAIGLLQKILDQYPDDILADDAYFLQGEIYERQLGDKTKAMVIYREFLNKFPGSVYAAEARKRFRQLRGDFSDHPAVN